MATQTTAPIEERTYATTTTMATDAPSRDRDRGSPYGALTSGRGAEFSGKDFVAFALSALLILGPLAAGALRSL
jgi:hypothetical protein